MSALLRIETLFVLATLLTGVLLLTGRRQKGATPGMVWVFAAGLILGALVTWAAGLAGQTPAMQPWRLAFWSLVPVVAVLAFAMVLEATVQNKRLGWGALALLVLLPWLVLGVMALRARLMAVNSEALIETWWQVPAFYSSGWLAAGLALALTSGLEKDRPGKSAPRILLSGSLACGTILCGLGASGWLADGSAALALTGLTLVGLGLTVLKKQKWQTNAISREELFDSINDGLILLNGEDKILDMNLAAERVIGLTRNKARGTSVEKILTNWKSLQGSNGAREIEFRGSLNLNKQWRQISVRINKLDERRGKVITLRDITERKGNSEARLRAREEMFNILRSFFKSASTSQSPNDFFRDVLLQLAYTFHADSGAICLVDPSAEPGQMKFSLMAKYGALAKDPALISEIHAGLDISRWVQGQREPLIISDAGKNPQFARMKEYFENVSIAVCPLLFNETLMGVLMLVRTEAVGFLSDETVRMGVVTEELASFIHADRQRKADITLAERLRLAQDLHDSITQELCALVAMTEAVKLGLESGAEININEKVEKISENARQALREMRLFLFQLIPVNLAKDGLVNTLQKRLASVEGRADIHPRMIADSTISLSPELETELYYLVEEALNNTLKHAHAKSVLIKFKKRKDSIYLEIVDNGNGFDPRQVEEGHRGLGNMEERARRINAKLNISSAPGEGTKITLVVPQ